MTIMMLLSLKLFADSQMVKFQGTPPTCLAATERVAKAVFREPSRSTDNLGSYNAGFSILEVPFKVRLLVRSSLFAGLQRVPSEICCCTSPILWHRCHVNHAGHGWCECEEAWKDPERIKAGVSKERGLATPAQGLVEKVGRKGSKQSRLHLVAGEVDGQRLKHGWPPKRT